MTRVARWIEVGRAVVNGIQSDRITFISASLAYYAFVSLVPLLLLGLVAADVFGGTRLAEQLADQATTSLGPEAGQLVSDALTRATRGAVGATLAGGVVLVWSALKLFRGLDVAFSTVYGTVGEVTLFDQIRDGAVTLAAVTVAVAATVAVGYVVKFYGLRAALVGTGTLEALGTIALVLGLTAAFLPLYYVLPDRGLTVREALPGAVFAAVGWTVLETVFRLYAVGAGSYEAYGVLGAVLLLVTFLYFGALILLVGVVLNAVLAGRIDEETDLDAGVDQPHPDREEVELSLMGDIEAIDVEEASDEELAEQVRGMREDLAEFEDRIEERTVRREDLERDLKQYVRSRIRSGKARGWGPYLVLLYGTAMTIGAFFLLEGVWAVLAMLVVWLSTLGLYVLMVLVGATLGVAGLPGRIKDRLQSLR